MKGTGALFPDASELLRMCIMMPVLHRQWQASYISTAERQKSVKLCVRVEMQARPAHFFRKLAAGAVQVVRMPSRREPSSRQRPHHAVWPLAILPQDCHLLCIITHAEYNCVLQEVLNPDGARLEMQDWGQAGYNTAVTSRIAALQKQGTQACQD